MEVPLHPFVKIGEKIRGAATFITLSTSLIYVTLDCSLNSIRFHHYLHKLKPTQIVRFTYSIYTRYFLVPYLLVQSKF